MTGDDVSHESSVAPARTPTAVPPAGIQPQALPTKDVHALAELLSPALRTSCGGRLGPIEWFHATWQRGGACTGFSTFNMDPDGPPVPVLVKLPVAAVELRWTAALGGATPDTFASPGALASVTPRVLAGGGVLGGYDVGWLVMERLAGPHMPKHMDASQVTELVAATMEFHAAAGACEPLTAAPPAPSWEVLIERSRETCKNHVVEGEQHWNDVLKRVKRALPFLRATWDRRPINTWCHGDLHPGNAMRRVAAAGGVEAGGFAARSPLVLIDLALVHAGHWMEDVLYLERQYWGHAALLHGIKPVSLMARLRRERGLPVDDFAQTANARRILMAACAPAMVEREGNPRYLASALEMIERLLPQVPH